MYIIGVLLMFILPLAAGYTCKGILRWKETNQIETYLIGFFFLFFLQGVILVPSVFAGISFAVVSMVFMGLCAVLFLSGLIWFCLQKKKDEKQEGEPKKIPARKRDKYFLALTIGVFGLVIVRMILGEDILRDDIVLETVNTTLQTETMFSYHPLTGMLMDGGLIASKKIITLPLFYASLCKITGVEAQLFLYLIINVMVLVCSYFAATLLFTKVGVVTRRKMYVFWLVYGLLLLAGDYHKSTLAYKLLYQGYEGTTICFAVLLPYLLYILISWYKKECEEEKLTLGEKMSFVLRFALAFAPSIVITGLGTGFLFLFIAVCIAGICCLFKSVKEVRACKE